MRSFTRISSIADWFSKEDYDLVNRICFSLFLQMKQAYDTYLGESEDPNFIKLLREEGRLAYKLELPIRVGEPSKLTIWLIIEAEENDQPSGIHAAINQDQEITIYVALSSLLKRLTLGPAVPREKFAFDKKLEEVVFHELTHFKDPKRIKNLETTAPWGVKDPDQTTLEYLNTEEGYRDYKSRPWEEDAFIGEMIPHFVKLIKNNKDVPYNDLAHRAYREFRVLGRGLRDYQDEERYKKRMKKFMRTFDTLYKRFHEKIANVKGFARQAYQVESPSPIYKERMQPRDNEVEIHTTLDERIQKWIETNVPKEYPTNDSLYGRCAAYAAALVKTFGGTLIKGMNTRLKPGDTCHFWAVVDGEEYDPTGHWYPGGSNYNGEPVSIEKNMDHFTSDPVFQKLTNHRFASVRYDPPMSLEEIKTKGYSHLLEDPLHKWRAEQGIELIHKEPTLEELERIWNNWQLMSSEQKRISDQKSEDFFGMNNEEHYYKLQKEMKQTLGNVIQSFTREAAPWTDKELTVLKNVYKQARDQGIPHNKIYQRLSDFIPHSARGIKQKLEALYRSDEDLAGYKFEHWDRGRILEALVDLYRAGEPVSRKALPSKLEYQITNHSLPKAITRGFEVFFDSFDHAIAEAILSVGCGRNDLGELDQTRSFADLDDAWHYYRRNEKQNNPWTKDEIVQLFQKAHSSGLPLTKSFFTSHPDVYKPLLDVSRSLDGLRKSVDRLGLMWGDLVIEAVPDYESWYNEEGKPLNSMGELRVIRFLDLNGIPYRRTCRKDKIPVTEPEVLEAGYRNFVPDIFILDEDGNDIGLVEIYGAIADSGAAAGELSQKYREKIEAKEKVYKNLPLNYIAIHDNGLYGCDLSDDRLREKFGLFICETPTSIDEP